VQVIALYVELEPAIGLVQEWPKHAKPIAHGQLEFGKNEDNACLLYYLYQEAACFRK
jgi:hypothetical protein